MTLSLAATVRIYKSLDDGLKAEALIVLCHDLTIAGRDVLTEGSCEEQNGKLTAINEILHRALAQILAYREGKTNRYDDESLIMNFVKRAKNSGLLGHLQFAFGKALRAHHE
jgi:hypothetical protein